MKFSLSVFALAALLLAGCGDDSSKPASGSTPANAPADYVGALGRSQNKAVGTIDLASLKQAIQLFNVNEGRYPKDLHELVDAKLISKVPDAPNGKKLVYDAASGDISLAPE